MKNATGDVITLVVGIFIGLWLAIPVYVGVFNGVIITEEYLVKRGFAEYNSTNGDFILKGDDNEQ